MFGVGLFPIHWILKEDHLAGTGLAAPNGSVDAVGVEVAVLFDISNKDATVIDDQDSICI